jgi:hypothetical protein
VSPEQTRELAEATRDLGFGRTTTSPGAEPATPAAAGETPAPVQVREPAKPDKSTPAPRAAATPEPAAAAQTPRRGPALKFDVPDEVWTALRREALNRRVTVKYLVLEALAAKGYEVDLSAVPEDGRRLR